MRDGAVSAGAVGPPTGAGRRAGAPDVPALVPGRAVSAVFPPLVPGRVHRWGSAALVLARRADLDRAAPRSPLLTPAERHVLDGLAPRRGAEWTAGRILAKALVAEVTGKRADGVEILPRADGSPRLSMPGLLLSLSHTAGHVAAAVAAGPVGVDVCETSRAPEVLRAADHVLRPEELPVVGHDAERLAAAWALKEAAVKAGRQGLFGEAPRRVRILGLTPPALDGGHRALVRTTGTAVVALVLAPPTAGTR
ncbi:4'-phosphopantetheinyl transferase superfamily protein [Streptomyces griseosporeus]|uniref:4'-phosphopantetheinyl transferase superfamily protein n=1 Tax=Streptomyces griseosporeus TaxID=1910 RepID=UPI0036C61968